MDVGEYRQQMPAPDYKHRLLKFARSTIDMAAGHLEDMRAGRLDMEFVHPEAMHLMQFHLRRLQESLDRDGELDRDAILKHLLAAKRQMDLVCAENHASESD